MGPVGSNARRILALLRDPARPRWSWWRCPRRWRWWRPSSSTAWPKAEVGIEAAAVVLNACHERRFSGDEEAEVLRLSSARAPLARSAAACPSPRRSRPRRRQVRRRKLTRFYEARLRRALPLPLLAFPSSFATRSGQDEVRLLADRLEAGHEARPPEPARPGPSADRRILVVCGAGGRGQDHHRRRPGAAAPPCGAGGCSSAPSTLRGGWPRAWACGSCRTTPRAWTSAASSPPREDRSAP